MKLLNTIKVFNAIPPGAIKDNAAWSSYVIDKAEFLPMDARGILFLISLGATDIAVAALKVQQSSSKTNDTTLGGSPSDVHDFDVKPDADDDNGIWALYVPMSAWTERYLQLQGTAGNGSSGTYLAAIAIADLPGATEATAESLGVTNLEIAG